MGRTILLRRTVWRFLALVLLELGDEKGGSKMCEDVLELRKTFLGAGHPRTLLIMARLADCWRRQHRHHDAMTLMRNCVDVTKRALSDNDPTTQRRIRRLEEWEQEAWAKTPSEGQQV